MSSTVAAFKKLGFIITDDDTIIPGFHGSTDPLKYNFLGAWDLVDNVLTCYEPGTGNVVQEILPVYTVKQVHTFAMYYQVKARDPNEALLKLQMLYHEPVEEEFLFMNDVSDWEVTIN